VEVGEPVKRHMLGEAVKKHGVLLIRERERIASNEYGN
jgi:hypothetical protein